MAVNTTQKAQLMQEYQRAQGDIGALQNGALGRRLGRPLPAQGLI